MQLLSSRIRVSKMLLIEKFSSDVQNTGHSIYRANKMFRSSHSSLSTDKILWCKISRNVTYKNFKIYRVLQIFKFSLNQTPLKFGIQNQF